MNMMKLGTRDALVNFIIDGDCSYYTIETKSDTCDFEKLSSVEKFLENEFLLPYWMGDEEEFPELKHIIWANNLTDGEEMIEKLKLGNKQKNSINFPDTSKNIPYYDKAMINKLTQSGSNNLFQTIFQNIV